MSYSQCIQLLLLAAKPQPAVCACQHACILLQSCSSWLNSCLFCRAVAVPVAHSFKCRMHQALAGNGCLPLADHATPASNQHPDRGLCAAMTAVKLVQAADNLSTRCDVIQQPAIPHTGPAALLKAAWDSVEAVENTHGCHLLNLCCEAPVNFTMNSVPGHARSWKLQCASELHQARCLEFCMDCMSHRFPVQGASACKLAANKSCCWLTAPLSKQSAAPQAML